MPKKLKFLAKPIRLKDKPCQISTNFFGNKSNFSFELVKSFPTYLPLLFLFVFVLPNNSFAGTGGSAQFQAMATTIEGYITGIPALILLLCGLFYSIFLLSTKHTIIPLGMVILAAILCSNGPTMISGLVSALI